MSLGMPESETGLGPKAKWGLTPVSVQAGCARPSGLCFIGARVKAKRNGYFAGCHWESVGPRPPEYDFNQEGPLKSTGWSPKLMRSRSLLLLVRETDRSTPSSHDHPSASHSPCDLGAKLHSPRKKGIPSGVSPKIVSLARKGLTCENLTGASHNCHQDIDRSGDPIAVTASIPRPCSWPNDNIRQRMTITNMPGCLRSKGSGVFVQPLFT